MKRRTYHIALLAVVVLLAGFGLTWLWPQTPIESAPVSPPAPPARLVCYGSVDARHGVLLLQPARAGRVVQVFVQEKQTVGANAPLVQLDDRLLKQYEEEAELAVQADQVQLSKAENGRKQYQARQAQAKAALQLAQNKLRQAQHYLSVKEDLLKDGAGNPGQLELARDQVTDARTLVTVEENKLAELNALNPELEVQLAKLQLRRSQAQRRRAADECAELLLKAPVAGTILRVQVQAGDLAAPTAPQPAVWLVPTGALIVRAEVAQEFADRVQAGQGVQVEDEASARVLGQGTISAVSDWFLPRRQLSALPTAVNTGLTRECVIDLAEPHDAVRLGQRVRVRILAAPEATSSAPGQATPGNSSAKER